MIIYNINILTNILYIFNYNLLIILKNNFCKRKIKKKWRKK